MGVGYFWYLSETSQSLEQASEEAVQTIARILYKAKIPKHQLPRLLEAIKSAYQFGLKVGDAGKDTGFHRISFTSRLEELLELKYNSKPK